MHLRTHAILEILSVGSSRNIFSTLWWHRFFSTGWKSGAVASLNLRGKRLKMSKNIFLQSFYKQTPYTLLLLERGSLPIEIMAMERVVAYMFKVKKSPSHRLPRIAYEASKKIQKTHKSFVFWLDARYGKLFGRWDATQLLHDALIDSSIS